MLPIARFILLFLFSIQLWSGSQSFSWYTMEPNQQVILNVELFLSSNCPYCHKTDAFFKKLEPATPWLRVHHNFINEDKGALELFNQFLTELKFNDFAVPSIFFCNSRWVGFDTEQTTGRDLLKALAYCKQQIEKKGTLTEATVNTLQLWGNANKFNTSITEQPSAFHYVLLVALLDITNPCSLFCLAAFLCLLFIQDQRGTQLITGLFFILAVALVHFVQQTQANIFFQTLPWLRILAVLTGLGSLYLLVRTYKKETIKPYLYYSWAFLLSLTVYSYQQTCVMNWSSVFEQWLNNQAWSTAQKLVIQLIYQGFYSLPAFLVLLIYLMLLSLKAFASLKPRLKTVGLCFIGLTALVLVLYPMALVQFSVSIWSVLAAILAGIVLTRYRPERY